MFLGYQVEDRISNIQRYSRRSYGCGRPFRLPIIPALSGLGVFRFQSFARSKRKPGWNRRTSRANSYTVKRPANDTEKRSGCSPAEPYPFSGIISNRRNTQKTQTKNTYITIRRINKSRNLLQFQLLHEKKHPVFFLIHYSGHQKVNSKGPKASYSRASARTLNISNNLRYSTDESTVRYGAVV